MRALRSFALFWYDFIVGDDPLVAVGIIASLALTAALSTGVTTVWWLMPAAVAIMLAGTLARAVRRR